MGVGDVTAEAKVAEQRAEPEGTSCIALAQDEDLGIGQMQIFKLWAKDLAGTKSVPGDPLPALME